MMSDKAVDAMLSSEFKLGADASVTVGPIGRGVEASRSTDLTSDIYAFSKSVGLFGGGALEGAKIFTRTSLNESYYGTAATPKAIVIDRKFTNLHADSLRQPLPLPASARPLAALPGAAAGTSSDRGHMDPAPGSPLPKTEERR